MGLIKALGGAVGGALADQWKECFYCEALDVDVLMEKGQKSVNGNRSSNTKASDNIISNGSVIAVADGQFMIIVQQGEIVEFCGEPGEFTWDASSEPSLFSGPFGESLVNTFKVIGRRFTFGGDTGRDQRVYYFNTKEIVGNKYGTANPVPFRVVDARAGIDIDISVMCNGEYSYKLTDPLLFYKNVCGNEAEEYRREQIDSQLKAELLTALQPAFAKISAMGIRYSQVPAHTEELAEALNDELSAKWHDLRGLEIASFGINTIKATPEDEKIIKDLQRAAALKDPTMAAARMADAQAEAMQTAAGNESAGPVMAFAGMNMANNAGGVNANQLYGMGQQGGGGTPANAPSASTPSGVGVASAAPAGDSWTCECGATNQGGKFCASCGKPRPVAAGPKFCPNCGFQFPDGSTPKFCPNCGNPTSQTAPAAPAAPEGGEQPPATPGDDQPPTAPQAQ